MQLRAHAREIDRPRRKLSKTLWRTYFVCLRRGYWPSAVDLQRGVRSRHSLWRDLELLRQTGFVVKVSSRQWAVTPAGFELLGLPPIAPKRKWRDSKWRLRDQKAIVETLDSAD